MTTYIRYVTPLKFGKVEDDFLCNNKITSLEGCPSFVGGTFVVE